MKVKDSIDRFAILKLSTNVHQSRHDRSGERQTDDRQDPAGQVHQVWLYRMSLKHDRPVPDVRHMASTGVSGDSPAYCDHWRLTPSPGPSSSHSFFGREAMCISPEEQRHEMADWDGGALSKSPKGRGTRYH